MVMFGLAGLFGMLAGLSLVGLTTSADANIALRYTLLSIAGVILGGGEFTGGRVSPVGAVIGAMTLTLAGSFLSFLRIPPDWQIGAQGGDPDPGPGAARPDRPPGAPDMRRLLAQPWLWAWLAAIATWLVTGIVTGGMGAGEVLTAAFTFATFSVIVALGQMFVVTLGPGNVDLSIPATITLAGAVAIKVMDTQDTHDPGRPRGCARSSAPWSAASTSS